MNSHLFEHTQFEIIQSTGEIMRLLETERVPEMPLIFSDLFLGTWTPYQIAADFMEQLSIKYDEISGSEQATEKSSPAFYENKTLIPFSKYTQLGIDAESSGSLAEKKSLVYAEMIVAESLKVESCMYAVLFPHGDFLFSEENYSFLFHLVNLIRPEDKLIFLFYPGASTLSLFPQHYASDLNIKTAPVLPQKVNIPDSHLYLIPGIITENLSDFFSEVCASKLARINSTARMIPLECRLSILPNRKKAAEKLAAAGAPGCAPCSPRTNTAGAKG